MIEFLKKENSFIIAFPIFRNKRADWTSYLRKNSLIGLPTRKQRIHSFSQKGKAS